MKLLVTTVAEVVTFSIANYEKMINQSSCIIYHCRRSLLLYIGHLNSCLNLFCFLLLILVTLYFTWLFFTFLCISFLLLWVGWKLLLFLKLENLMLSLVATVCFWHIIRASGLIWIPLLLTSYIHSSQCSILACVCGTMSGFQKFDLITISLLDKTLTYHHFY